MLQHREHGSLELDVEGNVPYLPDNGKEFITDHSLPVEPLDERVPATPEDVPAPPPDVADAGGAEAEEVVLPLCLVPAAPRKHGRCPIF